MQGPLAACFLKLIQRMANSSCIGGLVICWSSKRTGSRRGRCFTPGLLLVLLGTRELDQGLKICGPVDGNPEASARLRADRVLFG